jgi:chromodomain-helicase-DNA-binding protein 7
MNVIVYNGNKETRLAIREHEWLYNGTQQIKFHILLTTYEMLMAEDWTELTRVPWKCCVIDEAQRLKNSNSKLAQNLKHFRMSHRVLLTGTPIQNNTTELWSLLNFIAPETFSSRELFVRRFGSLHNKEQVDDLHRILKPFLLRRLKGDVEKSIPPKEETIVEVELSKLQKQYYRAILDRNRSFLNKGLSAKNTPNLVNVMMQLRKVCNHPYLIKGCEENDLVGVPPAQHVQKMVSGTSV